VAWENLEIEILQEFVDSEFSATYKTKDITRAHGAEKYGDLGTLSIRDAEDPELQRFYCWKYRHSAKGKEARRRAQKPHYDKNRDSINAKRRERYAKKKESSSLNKDQTNAKRRERYAKRKAAANEVM
jgi:hypothetical protein